MTAATARPSVMGDNGCPPSHATGDYAATKAALKRFLASAPQQTVARWIGRSRQTVSHYLADKREPSLFEACCIARRAGYRLALVKVED